LLLLLLLLYVSCTYYGAVPAKVKVHNMSSVLIGEAKIDNLT